MEDRFKNTSEILKEVCKKLEKSSGFNTEFLKKCSEVSQVAITFEDSMNVVKAFMNAPNDKSYRKCLNLSKKFKHGRKYKKTNNNNGKY